MRDMLITYFNDANPAYVASLQDAANRLPGITSLKHAPQFSNAVIDEDAVEAFKQVQMVPTLAFLDPVGYRGLSLELVGSLLKDWGCECIMFFNYNRINMGLADLEVEHRMNLLFGKERAARLRTRLAPLSPSQRELTIVEEISQAIREQGIRYVLPFRFKNDAGSRTSHYLIFMSKSYRGYQIMKNVMASESSQQNDGVASFEYCLADSRQPFLFKLSRPLQLLEGDLLESFAGKTLTMGQIFEMHNIDTPYVEKNYKEALRNLEERGEIIVDPPATKRRKGTFAEHVRVIFPSEE
jgi:three-Cys-motif partner protein